MINQNQLSLLSFGKRWGTGGCQTGDGGTGKCLFSNVKLFARDSLIFLVVRESRSSSLSLNEDLSKISQWGYKWKMFNPDASKEAQEIFFLRKKKSF